MIIATLTLAMLLQDQPKRQGRTPQQCDPIMNGQIVCYIPGPKQVGGVLASATPKQEAPILASVLPIKKAKKRWWQFWKK